MYARANRWINISGLSRAPLASAAPVAGRAPPRAGRHVSRSVVKDFAAGLRIAHNSPAGRSNDRKKCSVVITLAASLTASGSAGFRLWTRSRYRRLWPLRFSWPAAVSRYRCWAFHRDHFRAFSRHRSLQYRWRACGGGKRCSHPLSRHRRARGRRTRRFRRPVA